MRVIALVSLIILVAGCSTLEKRMKSYVGSHRDHLIQRWGPPTQEAKLSTGGHSLVYVNTWGDGNGLYTCRKVFNTDEKEVVRSWTYSGCPLF